MSDCTSPLRRGCCLSNEGIMELFGWLMVKDEDRQLAPYKRLGWDIDLYVPWERYKELDFSEYEFIMVRTAWNYSDNFPAFIEALRYIRCKYPRIPFFNNVDVIQWNGNKLYLSDLARMGVPTIPSVYVSEGRLVSIPSTSTTNSTPILPSVIKSQEIPLPEMVVPSQLLEAVFVAEGGCFHNAHQLVIKPTVSNDSDFTFRFTKEKLSMNKGEYATKVLSEQIPCTTAASPATTAVVINGADVHGAWEGSSKDGLVARIEQRVGDGAAFKDVLDILFDSQKAPQDGETVRSGYLVQPFVDSVVDDGEYSVFLFGDRINHVIRKKPKKGDFRVQEGFGGSVELVPGERDPNMVEVVSKASIAIKTLFGADAASRYDFETTAAARGATPTADPAWPVLMFARIDMMKFEGSYVVVECELIEPALYFHADEGKSAEAFTAHVTSVINGLTQQQQKPAA